MKKLDLNREWSFGHGNVNIIMFMQGQLGEKTVDLPHDYMIESDVFPEAIAAGASGWHHATTAFYNKNVMIPEEWQGERVWLHFDGAMMNTTVEVNGSKAGLHHNGYTPFSVDLTDLLEYGAENRILVTTNPSMQPNSRWYSGAGLFRGCQLWHGPAVHLAEDAIFGWTKKIEDGTAYLALEAEVANETGKNRIVKVTFDLDGQTQETKIQVNAHDTAIAHTTMTVDSPRLWSAETPELYTLSATVTDEAVMTTRPVPVEEKTTDSDSVLFGIRTIDWDVRHGLRVNNRTVKLAGGCLHHDNGPLGAVTCYDAEARKLQKLKDAGFNAVRTTHNPPSSAFVEACDRIGLYIFDEAFDAWGMGKQPGDYNQYFETDWKEDLTTFIKRDRSHPSVLIWSTGNEITERGGLGGGYELSRRLAETVRALDPSRPVSNAICSFWSGLDDKSMMEMMMKARSGMAQNADPSGKSDPLWEERTEMFTNGLDIVGYNYLEGKYPMDHEWFPERIILGSENYPKEIGEHWPMILETPWIVGDFTWTAFDYLGEAGIGRAKYVEADDPILQMGPHALQTQPVTYPWRTAFDADFDICGFKLTQGAYRSVVFGSDETALFSYDPAQHGKIELMTPWGFTQAMDSWTWPGQEQKPAQAAVFSRAEEVELFLNGESVGICRQGERLAADLPLSFLFDLTYEPGELVAVSRTGGKEVSRAALQTVGAPAKLVLVPERSSLPADGQSLCYVTVEVQDEAGRRVPDACVALKAAVSGAASLLAFGSGAPVTEENYTKGSFTSYEGRALAVLRAGWEAGEATLTVTAEGLGEASVQIPVE